MLENIVNYTKSHHERTRELVTTNMQDCHLVVTKKLQACDPKVMSAVSLSHYLLSPLYEF